MPPEPDDDESGGERELHDARRQIHPVFNLALHVDLIILGTTARGGWNRLINGSTTKDVTHSTTRQRVIVQPERS